MIGIEAFRHRITQEQFRNWCKKHPEWYDEMSDIVLDDTFINSEIHVNAKLLSEILP